LAEWLERSLLALKVSGPVQVVRREFSKIFSVHPSGNGYPVPFRLGEGEGVEEEEWRSTSVTHWWYKLAFYQSSPHLATGYAAAFIFSTGYY